MEQTSRRARQEGSSFRQEMVDVFTLSKTTLWIIRISCLYLEKHRRGKAQAEKQTCRQTENESETRSKTYTNGIEETEVEVPGGQRPGSGTSGMGSRSRKIYHGNG